MIYSTHDCLLSILKDKRRTLFFQLIMSFMDIRILVESGIDATLISQGINGLVNLSLCISSAQCKLLHTLWYPDSQAFNGLYYKCGWQRHTTWLSDLQVIVWMHTSFLLNKVRNLNFKSLRPETGCLHDGKRKSSDNKCARVRALVGDLQIVFYSFYQPRIHIIWKNLPQWHHP